MPMIDVSPDSAVAWPELEGRPAIDLTGPDDPPLRLALRPGGLRSGRSSVVLRLDLPDGRSVLSECTLAALAEAVELLEIADHRHNYREPDQPTATPTLHGEAYP
jgi:hypothetical protein